MRKYILYHSNLKLEDKQKLLKEIKGKEVNPLTFELLLSNLVNKEASERFRGFLEGAERLGSILGLSKEEVRKKLKEEGFI